MKVAVLPATPKDVIKGVGVCLCNQYLQQSQNRSSCQKEHQLYVAGQQ